VGFAFGLKAFERAGGRTGGGEKKLVFEDWIEVGFCAVDAGKTSREVAGNEIAPGLSCHVNTSRGGLRICFPVPLFSVVTHFAETLGKPGFDEASEHFQAAKLRDALDHCTPALAQTGRAQSLQATPGLRGTAFVNALLTDLEGLLD